MIPALAFNDANTKMTNDANLISDHYAAVTPTLNGFSLLEGKKLFKAKKTNIKVKNILVAATSKSAIYFEREDAEIFGLNIPINGLVTTETDGKKFIFHGGADAFLSTPGKHKTTASGSGVFFRLDKTPLHLFINAWFKFSYSVIKQPMHISARVQKNIVLSARQAASEPN